MSALADKKEISSMIIPDFCSKLTIRLISYARRSFGMRLTSNLLVGCIWAVSFVLVLGGNSATAAGFREIVAGNVALGVWYPSDAPTAAQRLGPFEIELARDAPARAGKHPIILFFHGNSGFYRNHHLTVQALADAGFVVIAPQHEADYLMGGTRPPPH